MTSSSLRGRGPINEDWILLGGGDGFVCRVDASDSDIVYWEFQDGNMFRRNLRTGHTVARSWPRRTTVPPFRDKSHTPAP